MKSIFTLLCILFFSVKSFSQVAKCVHGSGIKYLLDAYTGGALGACNCQKASEYLFSMPVCENTGNYELFFEDNFDGSSLDLLRWEIQPWGQGALQDDASIEYNSIDNSVVSNGTLKIIAKKEMVTKRAVSWKNDNEILSDGFPNVRSYEYTSSNIWTKEKFFHGKYEILARLPNGKGLWPAFWMFGGQRWNEIDVFDNYSGINTFVTSVGHDYDGNGTAEGCNQSFSGYDFSQWHTFTCIFDFDRIIWKIDGNIVRSLHRFQTLSNDIIYCGEDIAQGTYFLQKSFPIEPMSIILNLAIGSDEGPSTLPDANTTFPSQFEIDYVRFYKYVQLPNCDVAPDLLIIGTDNGGTVNITTIPQVNFLPNATIAAKNSIISVGHVIPMPGQTWRAESFIDIGPGFETLPGTEWTAEIGGCIELFSRLANQDTSGSGGGKTKGSQKDSTQIQQVAVTENKQPGSDSLNSAESHKSPIYISPNPSSDGKFSINCTMNEVGCMDAEITIMNSLGQTVHSQPFSNFRFPAPLDISTLPRGTYLIKIHNADKIFVHKAVFQ